MGNVRGHYCILSWAVLIAAAASPSHAADGIRAIKGASFNENSNCVVRQLYENLLSQPLTGQSIRRDLSERDLLLSTGYELNEPSRALRRPMLAMSRDPEMRPVLIDSILADMRSRSEAIASRIDRAEAKGLIDESVQAYDYVVVGTGIHDQIFNNVLTRKNPALKGLSIGDGDAIAENFALAQDFFRINSSNRSSVAGVVPKPGMGNLNEFPDGIVQVPDLDPSRFPPARVLSDAATINRSTDSADVLFRHKVVEVTTRETAENPGARKWPAKYRVTLEDQRGKRKSVYADRVVNAGGLGLPNIPVSDAASRNEIFKAYEKIAKNPDADTTLISFEDAVRRAARSDHPYQPYVGKDVAIIGGREIAKGDSAKVFIEWLAGFAPAKSYGRDVAQLGRYKSVDWVGISAKDCREYINNTRARYADIATAFKDGSVSGVDGRLESVSQSSDGKWTLVYRSRDGTTQKVQKDVVIFATGYEPQSSKLYSKLVPTDGDGISLGGKNPIQNSDRVESVTASVKGISGTPVVAKKLKDHQIYFVGPDAGEIVAKNEQAGVTENVASIFATGPRTAALADQFAAQSSRRFPRFSERKLPFQMDQARSSIPVILRESSARPLRSPTPYDEIYLSNRINRELNSIQVPRDTPVRLSVTRVEPGSYAVTANPSFGQLPAIAAELGRDPAFVERIAALLEDNTRHDTITWDAKFLARKNKGKAVVSSYTLRRENGNLASQFERFNYVERYRPNAGDRYSGLRSPQPELDKYLLQTRAKIDAILREPSQTERLAAVRGLADDLFTVVPRSSFVPLIESIKNADSKFISDVIQDLATRVRDLDGEILAGALKVIGSPDIRASTTMALLDRLPDFGGGDIGGVLKAFSVTDFSGKETFVRNLLSRIKPAELNGDVIRNAVEVFRSFDVDRRYNQQAEFALEWFKKIPNLKSDDLVKVAGAVDIPSSDLETYALQMLSHAQIKASDFNGKAIAAGLQRVRWDIRSYIAPSAFKFIKAPVGDDLISVLEAVSGCRDDAAYKIAVNFMQTQGKLTSEEASRALEAVRDPVLRQQVEKVLSKSVASR